MLFGVVLESAADLQKNAAKKVNPRRFVDTGLQSQRRECSSILASSPFSLSFFKFILDKQLPHHGLTTHEFRHLTLQTCFL